MEKPKLSPVRPFKAKGGKMYQPTAKSRLEREFN